MDKEGNNKCAHFGMVVFADGFRFCFYIYKDKELQS